MLLVTIDPIGSVAIFVALTANFTDGERNRIARKSVLIAGAVLAGFLVAGEIVLSELGVRLVSFQVAGGVVLFLFGLQMIFGTGVVEPAANGNRDIAVFPLALPAIASPGAIMAVVLLTDNHRQSIAQQAGTAVVLIVVLLLTWLALRASRPIYAALGSTGSNVLIRVLGLLLASLAAEQVIAGIEILR